MATLNDVITKLNETKVAKAGDTINGRLRIGEAISKSTNDTFFDIYGGTTHGDGAQLTLFGKNSSSIGSFSLSANDGSTIKSLTGFPDGTLRWGGKVVNVGGIYITQTWVSGTSWYRVWSDGYIEQGGLQNTLTISLPVTFPKPFTTANYTITAVSTSGEGVPRFFNCGTTGFSWQPAGASNTGYWHACGY